MTVYQCDVCDGDFPGGAKGSTFLVKNPSAATSHFCSGACLRAYVNGQPLPSRRKERIIYYGAGVIAGLIAEFIVRKFGI